MVAKTTPVDTKAALRQAYQSATQALRDSHRDEFNDLYTQHAAALGVQWTPRQTAEQRAAAEIAALLTKYPDLRQQFVPGTAESED